MFEKFGQNKDSSRTEKERNIREQWNININKQYIKTFPNVNLKVCSKSKLFLNKH